MEKNEKPKAAPPGGDRWAVSREVVERLTRLDPRLTVVYQNYRRDFGGDCTAAQLARHLAAKGHRWCPTRQTMSEWLATIRQLESEVLNQESSGLVN